MSRLVSVSVALLFVYYASFITGRPALQTKEPAASESPGVQLAFKPGLIERALLQGRALALSDPLLESDTEPEKLFRTMERSYSGDLFTIGAMSLWCAGFLLCFVAIARRVWFARSMTVYLLIPSGLALLLTLFAVRRPALQADRFLSYDHMLMAFVEFALLLLALASIFLAVRVPEVRTGFLDHLQARRKSWTSSLGRLPGAVLQIAAIGLVSAALANFIVLPVYYLQLSFPGFFGLLLLCALLILAFFYVRAYLRVSAMQGGATDAAVSMSFLGFRILSNSIFVAAVLSGVLLVITLVIMLTVANLDVLQTIGVLKRAARLE
jgi:hypothetical protein